MNVLKPCLALLLMPFLVACGGDSGQDQIEKSEAMQSEPQPVETAAALPELLTPCLVCHADALDPVQAPPFFAVQRRYKMQYPNEADFVNAMVEFVKQPELENALMKRPVQHLGLMPALPLPDDELTEIAKYLYGATFPLPCAHWKVAVKNAEAEGPLDAHMQDNKAKIERHCQ